MTVYILWFHAMGIQSLNEIYATHSLAIRGLRQAEKRLPKITAVFGVKAHFELEQRDVVSEQIREDVPPWEDQQS
jgi:hypothetical protein